MNDLITPKELLLELYTPKVYKSEESNEVKLTAYTLELRLEKLNYIPENQCKAWFIDLYTCIKFILEAYNNKESEKLRAFYGDFYSFDVLKFIEGVESLRNGYIGEIFPYGCCANTKPLEVLHGWIFDNTAIEALTFDGDTPKGFVIQNHFKYGAKPIEVKATPTPPDLPQELDTPEAREIFEALTQQGIVKKNGATYEWNNTYALFGYFVKMASEKLGIRHDNNRLPWSIFQRAFAVEESQTNTAKNFITKYNNGQANEPGGYDVINRLCK